jgi:hypothetical protein
MRQAEKQPRGSKFQQGREVLLSYFLRMPTISGGIQPPLTLEFKVV